MVRRMGAPLDDRLFRLWRAGVSPELPCNVEKLDLELRRVVALLLQPASIHFLTSAARQSRRARRSGRGRFEPAGIMDAKEASDVREATEATEPTEATEATEGVGDGGAAGLGRRLRLVLLAADEKEGLPTPTR